MKKIVLIGGGGHCRSVIDVIEQQAEFEIAGIIDKPKFLDSKIFGYSVIGNDKDIEILAQKYDYALITVGQINSPNIRIKLFNLVIKTGFKLPFIISPRAYLSKFSRVGKGTIIMHDAIVNANTIIGENCIINSKALIEHDCSISSHCHISTNVTINGNVKIGAKSFIGSNSTTKENISIKEDSFVIAGSLCK